MLTWRIARNFLYLTCNCSSPNIFYNIICESGETISIDNISLFIYLYTYNISTYMLPFQYIYIYIYIFFFLYICMGFCVYVPLPPLRGQHMVLCHPRWLPTSGLTEFAVCWGGAGFEPRTTDLQSGALPLSHLNIYTKSGTKGIRQPPFVLCKRKMEVCFPWSANDKR